VKYYLDTNAIYNLKNFSDDILQETSISCLGVFELISGITNEKGFFKRRSILNQVRTKNINTIWELPKDLIERAFSLPTDYSDAKATQLMMNHIIDCENYEALNNIKFLVDNKEYSIETFNTYDSRYSKEITDLFNNSDVPKVDIPEKDKIMTTLHKEGSIIEIFISSIGKEYRRPSEKYFSVLQKYTDKRIIDKYIKFLAAYSIDNHQLGKTSGKNDGFDIGHIIYMNNIEYFISDDKIYHNYPSEYANINVLSVNDLIQKA